MKDVTIKVDGMSCNHCKKAVEDSVGEMNGVEKVAVTLNTGKVDISFNPESVSMEAIKETIEDQGYDVA